MGRMKQSGFSLYELNEMKDFISDWRYNIKHDYDLMRLDVENIMDNKITFAIKTEKDLDLDEFDEIATNCMPKILIALIDWVGLDFGYQFTYSGKYDDYEPIDDYVYVDFVVW